jgi:serine/threonine protein kinase
LLGFGNVEFEGALNITKIAEYKIGKLLGQGGFAIVREAVHIETGHRVAIKIYDKYKLNKNTQMKKGVLREIQILYLIHNQFNEKNFTSESLSSNSYDPHHKKDMQIKDSTVDHFEKGHPNIMKMYDAIDT